MVGLHFNQLGVTEMFSFNFFFLEKRTFRKKGIKLEAKTPEFGRTKQTFSFWIVVVKTNLFLFHKCENGIIWQLQKWFAF